MCSSDLTHRRSTALNIDRVTMASFNRRRSLIALGSAACSLAWGAESVFGHFPSKLIRVVVPFPSGGGTEVIGRPLIQAMAEGLGQSIIIDNKPGAGTLIGSDFVAKSAPDGHTLLLTTNAIAINASLIPKLPYDTVRDLPPVGRICHGPNVIAVRSDSSIKNLDDLIRTAKNQPGKLSYASSGTGSAVHLAGELFKIIDRKSTRLNSSHT